MKHCSHCDIDVDNCINANTVWESRMKLLGILMLDHIITI